MLLCEACLEKALSSLVPKGIMYPTCFVLLLSNLLRFGQPRFVVIAWSLD